MNVFENVKNVRAMIEQNRIGQDVTLIAVTKTVSVEVAQSLYDAGIRHFGENRVEGLLEKRAALPEDATLHFIGSLQTRKVRQLMGQVGAIHSLDRESLAVEIDKRATQPVDCFVQVNISQEESKHGFTKEEVLPFIEKCKQYPHIRIIGLMTMAPFTEDDSLVRHVFHELAQLRDEIAALGIEHAPCTELSMGMSNDYAIAVNEGATFVRVGTVLVQ